MDEKKIEDFLRRYPDPKQVIDDLIRRIEVLEREVKAQKETDAGRRSVSEDLAQRVAALEKKLLAFR
jgi:hypothetical protein